MLLMSLVLFDLKISDFTDAISAINLNGKLASLPAAGNPFPCFTGSNQFALLKPVKMGWEKMFAVRLDSAREKKGRGNFVKFKFGLNGLMRLDVLEQLKFSNCFSI